MQLLNWLSVFLFALVASATETTTNEPPTELQIDVNYVPTSCPFRAQQGDKIKVHYTGKLFSNGKKFDSSLDRGEPLPLILGAGQVIRGWDEGLKGMCQGEKRTLTIPSNMAYGSRGFGNIIPPNSVLVFDVELVDLNTNNPREEL
ncbi:hypothetical protein NLI96_g7106 [Meripilus lineatus]|uniref:peptidylprolyl isomerase n=1 Tax=Meripilus lineatus TaxID=2056292 RepID=A0AAD5YD91_9APHY|nr:hypothetical protein NLI96_g7106 [Physisporinus lineatus]